MSSAPRAPDEAQEERCGDEPNPRPPQHIESGSNPEQEHHDARHGEHQFCQLHL
jgi:hypothetical protein